VAGWAVDHRGAESAFAVPALGAALAAVLAICGAPLLRRPVAVPPPHGGSPGVDRPAAG
jgi:hypothetical protein